MSETTPNIAKPKRRVLPWVALVILLMGTAGIAAYYWQQNLRVKQVLVKGNYFTPTEAIISKAAITEGIKPDSLDLENIIKSIESLHYVQSVTPFVDPLGNVELNVQERYPIALLVKGNNEIYVDAFGVRLPIISGKTQNLPLVYGFDARMRPDTLNSEAFVQIRNFLIGARRNEFGWATISEVTYDKQEGVVALSHENGVKLVFGVNNFDHKLENWEAFYSQVIEVKGIQTMQQIDLRFENQVVTREAGS